MSLTSSARTMLIAERGRECALCGAAPTPEAADTADTDAETDTVTGTDTDTDAATDAATTGDATTDASAATDAADEDVELQVHHKRPQADGGSDHPRNLVVLCVECHRTHHHNGLRPGIRGPAIAAEGPHPDGGQPVADGPPTAEGRATGDEPAGTDGADGGDSGLTRPLDPQRKPTERDSKVLAVIENRGPVRTGIIADEIDRSTQHTRRLLWKLAGEALIARTTDDRWDIRDRVDEEDTHEGLPEDPKLAYQAGRDEMIRRMAANNLPQEEIADIADCSRNTVLNAINRARALAVPVESSVAVDEQTADAWTIASQLRVFARMLDSHRGADGQPDGQGAVATEMGE